jgi:glucokinase
VGGTNTRIALFDEISGEFRALRNYRNRDYGGLEDILETWCAALEEAQPRHACIAAAAPPGGDTVTMINIGWSFSRAALARRFQLRRCLWLNDFQANAHALPHLGPAELLQLHAGEAGGHPTLATMGPGTGLGGATLRGGGAAVAADAEPGHAGLSPGNQLELALFAELLREHRDIYAELLLSGAGLTRLYRTITRVRRGGEPEPLSPAEVSSRALANSDPHCSQALATFCALLGSACGDFVLANGAYGGLFIAGGIAPRISAFLRDSEFLTRFQGKGAMEERLQRVPVYIITHPHPGLVGAAHAPLQGD